VLNDHWADMAEHGFLSNRLYDASASGAFVISDHAPGIEDEFDGGVVTYRDGAELRALVERYLDDPAARAEHARRARAAVLAAHTFEHRVDEILRVIGPRLPSPPMTVDANLGGAAPS
jgi:spore maturation protein CgeB